MKRRSLLVLVACLMLGVGSQALAQAKVHHVVFAVTTGDEENWQMTVRNIRNLMEGFKPDSVEVEVVAYSEGLGMVKMGSSVAPDLAALQGQGVKFVACMNSMRAQHVELKDLLAGVGAVPSGIVEVVRKQEAGWSYIKAGK
jgi:intracellular sulfur oxidation DsrE/DsrF family protein